MAFAELSVANEWLYEVEPELMVSRMSDEQVLALTLDLFGAIKRAQEPHEVQAEAQEEGSE